MPDHRIELDLEVKTYDIDIAGHVNNIVYRTPSQKAPEFIRVMNGSLLIVDCSILST